MTAKGKIVLITCNVTKTNVSVIIIHSKQFLEKLHPREKHMLSVKTQNRLSCFQAIMKNIVSQAI